MAALDKLNKIPVLYKIIVLLFVLLGIVGSFYLFEWTEIQKEVATLQDTQTKLQAKYKEQKAVADNLPTFQKNTQQLQRDLEQALEQLPRDAEIESLLRDIYTLGMKSGVSFRIFQPGSETRQQLYAELPITLEIEGSYHDVAVFFDRVGKLSRIVNISNVSARVRSGSGGTADLSGVTLSIKCLATTFRFVGGGG